jgi:hypothetical protein
MDIIGAKALKKRLGSSGAEEAPPPSVDVPEDAPPVYKWTGVRQSPPSDVDDEPLAETGSMFRRLGLSFR